MKKLVLLGAVAVAGLSSCTKDYTCTYGSGDNVISIDCNKCSKSDIEEIEKVSYTVGDETYGYDCKAK